METEKGLSPEYLEWQTAGAYLTLGRWVLNAPQCVAGN